MRMVAAVILCGLILLLAGGCTDDNTGAAASELSVFLLRDDDVVTVLRDLEAKSDYSTGDDYGAVSEADRAGPTENAEAGVVRQWSQDSGQAGEGEVWSVVSSVFRFPSAAEAESAAEAVFGLVGTGPEQVGDALVALTELRDGLSSGVVVVTRDALMATVEVDYVGRGDQRLVERLADAAAQRLG